MFLSTTVILTSVFVFVVVILALVTILLQAKARLSPSGPVKLNINGNDVEVDSGSTLLTTLSNQKIFLPSACGGGGTCGMCKCQVTDGGGEILPTETGFFNRKEIADNWRLGCQVKVKNDMQIAETYCGIYPESSPGGWHILGTTEHVLFDIRQSPSATFQSGDTVQFFAIKSI